MSKQVVFSLFLTISFALIARQEYYTDFSGKTLSASKLTLTLRIQRELPGHYYTFKHATITGNLTNETLNGADFRGAHILGNLTNMRLRHAKLQNAHLHGTLINVHFNHANLRRVRIHGELINVHFEGADLSFAQLPDNWSKTWKKVNFTGATWIDGTTICADARCSNRPQKIVQPKPKPAHIFKNQSYKDFIGHRIGSTSYTTYKGSDLTAAFIYGTFTHVDFTDANLTGAFIDGTFEDVSFNNATLIGANLSAARLKNVSFKGADLSGAALPTKENMVNVKF